MLLFYLSLIALPFLITAFPQNSDDTSVQVDGFIFDGPVSSGQSNGEQRITTTMTSTLSNKLYNACMNNCATTLEYNPICGTDNVEYPNPGRLDCAQSCGKEINFAIAKKFRVNRVEYDLTYGENIKYLFWNVNGVLLASEPLESAFCNG